MLLMEQDEELLSRLESLSKRILSRSREVNGSLTELANETRGCSVRTKNALNQLLLLCNTQFVENRVYEEEEDEENRRDVEETEPQVAAAADPKEQWDLALSLGIAALRQKVFYYYEDEEEEDDDDEAEDMYNSRPLPFVIGTRAYAASESAGIGEAVEAYGRRDDGDDDVDDEDTYEQVRADEIYEEEEEEAFGSARMSPPPRPSNTPTTNERLDETPRLATTQPPPMPTTTTEQPPPMPQTMTGPPMPSSDLFAPEDENGEIFADDPYNLFGAPRQESRASDAGSFLFGQGGDLFDDGEDEVTAEESDIPRSGENQKSLMKSAEEEAPPKKKKEIAASKKGDTFDDLFGTNDDLFGSNDDSIFGNESRGGSLLLDGADVEEPREGRPPAAVETSSLFDGGLFGDEDPIKNEPPPKTSAGLFDDAKSGGLFVDDEPKKVAYFDNPEESSNSLFSAKGGLFGDSEEGGLFEDSTMSFAEEPSTKVGGGLFDDDNVPSGDFFEDVPTSSNATIGSFFESPTAPTGISPAEPSSKVAPPENESIEDGYIDNPFNTPKKGKDESPSPHPIKSSPLFEEDKPTTTKKGAAQTTSSQKKSGLDRFGGLAIDPTKLLPGARLPTRKKPSEQAVSQQEPTTESTLDTSTLASRPTVSGGKKRRPTTKKKFVADDAPVPLGSSTAKSTPSLLASKTADPTDLFASDVQPKNAEPAKGGRLFADEEQSKAAEPVKGLFVDEEQPKAAEPVKVGGLFADEKQSKPSSEAATGGGLFSDEEQSKAAEPVKVLFADEERSKAAEPVKVGGLFADEEQSKAAEPVKVGGLFADEEQSKAAEPVKDGGLFADEEPSIGFFDDRVATSSDLRVRAGAGLFGSPKPTSSEVFGADNVDDSKKEPAPSSSYSGGGLFDDPPGGGGGGLFDDPPASKREGVGGEKPKSGGGLFGDGDDDDVFGSTGKSRSPVVASSSSDVKATPVKKKSSGLFDDDADDIFGSGGSSNKGGLFG